MFWTPAFAGVMLRETFYEIINLAGFVKVVTSVDPGSGPGQALESRLRYHHSKALDSGFRRNDGKTNFQARRRGA
jgi:hypothetical protein